MNLHKCFEWLFSGCLFLICCDIVPNLSKRHSCSLWSREQPAVIARHRRISYSPRMPFVSICPTRHSRQSSIVQVFTSVFFRQSQTIRFHRTAFIFRSCSAVEILISCSVVQSRHLIYDSFIKPKSTKTLVFSCFDGNKKPSHFRCNGLNNQILQFKINYCFLAIS